MVVSATGGDLEVVREVDRQPAYLRALGLAVRLRRERAGLSQESLAHESGLDRTYISGIERGVRNPTVGTLLRLAGALGSTVGSLLKATDKIAE